MAPITEISIVVPQRHCVSDRQKSFFPPPDHALRGIREEQKLSTVAGSTRASSQSHSFLVVYPALWAGIKDTTHECVAGSPFPSLCAGRKRNDRWGKHMQTTHLSTGFRLFLIPLPCYGILSSRKEESRDEARVLPTTVDSFYPTADFLYVCTRRQGEAFFMAFQRLS